MNYIKLYIILYYEWDFWRLQDDEIVTILRRMMRLDSDDETSNHSVHLYNVGVLN
jgi:hypothetical protein